MEINNCDVTYPAKVDGGNGKEAIGKVVQLLAGRASSLWGVAIIADADPDPEKSFKDICIGFAAPFKAPANCFEIADGKRHRTAVFLIPGKDKTGALEHLFLDAITQVNVNALQCVDIYRDCCQTTENWSENVIGKMRLTAYVAANCEKNPACSPAFLWTSKHQIIRDHQPRLPRNPQLSDCVSPLRRHQIPTNTLTNLCRAQRENAKGVFALAHLMPGRNRTAYAMLCRHPLYR